ncbi:MAG TPA: hypothetical protein VJU54_10990 [Nitrospiraceae bacterium]|nr:hypothetical protein [Nitrospiraceae bacterium]
MNSNSQSSPAEARPGRSAFFPRVVQFVLAPLILLLSGYFTANVLVSGHYTWARTTQTLALTLTVLILSYEFIYKEQLSRTESPDRARSALLYSCAVPYVIGVFVMLALWAL